MKTNIVLFCLNKFVRWVCKPGSVQIPAAYAADSVGGHFSKACDCSQAQAAYPPALNFEFQIKISKFIYSGKVHPHSHWREDKPAYLALQAVGFALPASSQKLRCALTAPFHHFQSKISNSKSQTGCVFSVALSLIWNLKSQI